MRIGNREVALTGNSNFRIEIAIDSRMNSRDANARVMAAASDLKTNITVAKNFFGKVFGINRNYPTLLNIRPNVIEIRQQTAEIWAARALAVITIYNLLSNTGIL